MKMSGGFLGLGNTFRAMTMSPIESALNEAHRMARRHLETGGSAASSRKPPSARPCTTDIVLPLDVDPVVIAQALRAKLGGGEADDVLWPLERKKLGGRVVLRGRHILRLGDNRYDKGRAFLHGLIKDQRARRWRLRFAANDSSRR
jgi:hypothetical protein